MVGFRFGRLDACDGSGQFAFGKRVGHEFVGALAQQLVQGGGADVFGDQDDLDAVVAGLGDDLAQHDDVVFVLGIHGDGDEFEGLGFGLVEEHQRFGKAEVTPLVAKRGFHVFDQQLEPVRFTADGASDDRVRFRLRWCSRVHCLKSYPTGALPFYLTCPFFVGLDAVPSRSGIMVWVGKCRSI